MLAEFIKDSSDISNPSAPFSFLWKRRGKDLENENINQAETLLTYLTHTNKTMRNIMLHRGQSIGASGL